jgi:hypothetical protein
MQEPGVDMAVHDPHHRAKIAASNPPDKVYGVYARPGHLHYTPAPTKPPKATQDVPNNRSNNTSTNMTCTHITT